MRVTAAEFTRNGSYIERTCDRCGATQTDDNRRPA